MWVWVGGGDGGGKSSVPIPNFFSILVGGCGVAVFVGEFLVRCSTATQQQTHSI